MRVVAIVLAAGASSRMGRPKMALPFGGTTMLGAVLDGLAGTRVDRTLVVLGYHESDVRRAAGDRSVEFVVNPDPSRGMLSSVQCGIATEGNADAYLIVLGDQPRIARGVVDVLIAAAERSSKSIVVPTYGGRRGHPLLLVCSQRDAVMALPLSVGLNSLIAERGQDIEEVEFASPEVLEDIDTPDDYQRLK